MLYVLDEIFIPVKVSCGNGSVNGLAVVAIVSGRDIGGDQLTFRRRERVRMTKQDFNQFVERFGGFGPEGHGPANAGEIGKSDMRHWMLLDESFNSWVERRIDGFAYRGIRWQKELQQSRK